MRIAVCDDERIYSSILERIIFQWAAHQEQVVNVDVYSSGEALLKVFDLGTRYDIAFLDIQMGGISGLDLAKHIRQWDMSMLIIFCTNFKDYVFEGYEVSAFRFLIKPVKEKKCLETLNVASDVCKSKQIGHFTIQTESMKRRIAKCDIVYINAEGHYLLAHTQDEVFKFRGKIAQVEKDFSPPMFAKCNRGIIVNVAQIFCITRDQVSMANQENLPVSRLYIDDLNRCYLAVHMGPLMATNKKNHGKAEG